MSFDPTQHPREATGQFAEKTGAAAEISLSESPRAVDGDFPQATEDTPSAHDSMIDSLARRKMTTPIALGNLLDGTSQDFIEDIADYHTSLSHGDTDTFSYAGDFGEEGKLFQKRYAASLEGEDILIAISRGPEFTEGKVTGTRGTEIQVDDGEWHDLSDTGNVLFARRSYDIESIESKTAKAARAITE